MTAILKFIETDFPYYKFVPYRVLKIELEGLKEANKKMNIYKALFNLQNVLEYKINGDAGFYGANQD